MCSGKPSAAAAADAGATSIFGTFITAIISPSLQTARAGEVGVRLREIGFAGVRVCASAGKTVFSLGCGGLVLS